MFFRKQISKTSPYRYFCATFGPCAAAGASASNKVILEYRLPFKARFVRAELSALTETGTAQVDVYNASATALLTSDNVEVVPAGFTATSTSHSWLAAGTRIQIRATTDSAEDLIGLAGTLIFESYEGANGLVNDLN